MEVRVVVPERLIATYRAARLVVEAGDGQWCLLPRHRDIVLDLVVGPGRLITDAGAEIRFGFDEGLLVKCADAVVIAV
ncbi:MAG: hypothetical protein ACYTF0_03965, partial [Planctomycetota bacterium]